MPDILGQPQPFFEDAQLDTANTVITINTSNVNLFVCRIILRLQFKLFSQTIIALF